MEAEAKNRLVADGHLEYADLGAISVKHGPDFRLGEAELVASQA